MKHNQLWIIVIGTLLILSGCGSQSESSEEMVETKALESGDYGAALPFLSSDSRQQHQIRTTSLVDSMYIGKGLLNHAKSHFSVNSYLMQEGQFLAFDELGSLLGRESDTNPDALNPAKDTEFDTGNGIIKEAVIVRDIYEIDFVKDKEIKGVALAIAFNSFVGDNDVMIKDANMQAFGEETARKLITYMRKIPEIGDDMPIYVALYKNTSNETALPGQFFSEAFFEGRSANFSAIDETWIMFPSEDASKLDNAAAAQFLQVKNSLSGYLPDDVSIIGKGRFENGKLAELRINVEMYAKTSVEALSLTQYLKTQLNAFSSLNYKIQVEVRCQDVTIATMVRSIGDSDVEVNTLL